MPEETEHAIVTYFRRLQESVTDEFEMLPGGFRKELSLSFLEIAFHEAIKQAAEPMYPDQAISGR